MFYRKNDTIALRTTTNARKYKVISLKFGYEGVFKILSTGSISLLVACPRMNH